MKNIELKSIYLFCFLFIFCSCNKKDEPMLNITFIMDPTAARLNNFGDSVTIPTGNAGQNPDFETLGLHFIGLYPNKFTPYEGGETVFLSQTYLYEYRYENWCQHEFTKGTWTQAFRERKSALKELNQPLDKKIYFAGEIYDIYHQMGVPGAILSG